VKIRRTGAYGILHDRSGRVLLARNSSASAFPGRWTLPGGGVEQGEHPDDAVVREFAEETGLAVRIEALRTVTADVARLPSGNLEHTDRIVYDVAVTGGDLRAEVDGTTDVVEWADPATRPLMPFTARLLGRPVEPIAETAAHEGEIDRKPTRVQRFGAYALAFDPDERILLAKISPGFPGAGHWHLPGGGTDHGETPEQGLARELFEETSQRGRVTGLLGISNRYDPAAVGPEGVPMDWHVIRVVFSVVVDHPTDPVVTEAAGGSTAEAGWFTRSEIDGMVLSELVRESLARIDVRPGS